MHICRFVDVSIAGARETVSSVVARVDWTSSSISGRRENGKYAIYLPLGESSHRPPNMRTCVRLIARRSPPMTRDLRFLVIVFTSGPRVVVSSIITMVSDESSVQEMDAQIARAKFSKLLRNSLWTCITEGPAIWKGLDGQEYIYEQSLMERNTKPIIWGIGCTLISFFSFRLSASRTFQQFRGRYIRQSAAAPLPINKATTPTEQRKELQNEVMNQAMSIPKDLLLSIALGVSATAFLLDWTQIRQDLERAPGLPGRSVLADCMCPSMMELYNKTPPRVWNEEGNDDETLQSMSTIVRNCQRRAKLEAAERKRRGLADDQPVSIPFPGFV